MRGPGYISAPPQTHPRTYATPRMSGELSSSSLKHPPALSPANCPPPPPCPSQTATNTRWGLMPTLSAFQQSQMGSFTTAQLYSTSQMRTAVSIDTYTASVRYCNSARRYFWAPRMATAPREHVRPCQLTCALRPRGIARGIRGCRSRFQHWGGPRGV